MMSGRPRQAIAVLGMHRSGTSAVARVVNLLGASLPAHPLEPACDNPTGFWESKVIAGTNELMLTTAGADTFNCLNFDAVAIGGAPLVEVLTGIMQTEFGDADFFLLKDPRLCVTLSLWLPTFESLGIRLSALLVLRNPVAVVQSLCRREKCAEEVAALLWLRHMLDAERQTRGFPRSVLSYDRMLVDWRRCMERAGREAGIAWPNSLDSVALDVDRFLRADLRHHHGSLERPPSIRAFFWHWVVEVYEALRRIEQLGPDYAVENRLDRLRGEFDAWCRQNIRG